MKKTILVVCLSLFALVQSFAQCTPNAPTGTAGVTPSTADLPCVVMGQPYNESIYVENFTNYTFSFSGLSGTITMDSLRVDSLSNIPCGLSYALNPASGVLHGGATGCINVNGTTVENAGQYSIGIYVTIAVTINVPPLLNNSHQTFSGRADSLVRALSQQYGINIPIDFNYWLRVTNCPSVCPAIDTTGGTDVLAGHNCNNPFSANVATCTTVLCAGQVDSLTAALSGIAAADVTFKWIKASDGTVLSTDQTAGITAPDSVLLVVADTSGNSDTVAYNVTALPLPTAGVTITGTDTVSFTSNALNAINYTYVITDSTGATVDSFVSVDGTGTFTTTVGGTYTVTQTANNGCGSDTYSDTFHIESAVGLHEINNINAQVALYPNPATDFVTLNVRSVASPNENYTLKIFNLQGQEVYTEQFVGSVNKQLNLSQLSNGVYLVHINSTNVSTVQKLILQ